jgi:hypothetical protein
MQAGAEAVPSGATSVSITFPTAFTADANAGPDTILVSMFNITDGSPMALDLVPTAKSNSAMTISWATPTDSANYVLSWVAAMAGEIESGGTIQEGVPFSSLPAAGATPSDSSLMLVVIDGQTKRVTVAELLAGAARVRNPPSTPLAPGEANQIAVDSNYLYYHTGAAWGRVALDTGWS